MFNQFEKALRKVVGAVSIISYVGIMFVMCFIVLDVVLRLVFRKPILGSYEIVERVEMCLVFATFAYANTEHAHVHVSMVIMNFPRKLRLFIYAVTEIVCGVMSLFIAYAAKIQAVSSAASGYTTGVLYIPLYPFYWIEALCMLVFAFALFYEGVRGILAMSDEAIAKEIEQSWS